MRTAGRYGAAVTGFTRRLPWTSLDAGVRAVVEEAVQASLGSAVEAARDVHGGMSPGPAAVLTTADGGQVFVKITSSELNQRSWQLYAEEIAAYHALAHLALPMPELLSVVENGPWVGLVLTLAPGRNPGPPWDLEALDHVVQACDRLQVRAPDGLPPVLDRLPNLDGWTELAASPDELPAGWLREDAARCAELVQGWQRWTVGTTLAHNDCRCDNVLVTDGGAVTLVDWNFASAAAPWLDRAQLAADVVASRVITMDEDHAQDGDDASDGTLAASLGLLSTVPEDASRFVVALCGMLLSNSRKPPHPALPTMRAWQATRAGRLVPLVRALVPALLS